MESKLGSEVNQVIRSIKLWFALVDMDWAMGSTMYLGEDVCYIRSKTITL